VWGAQNGQRLHFEVEGEGVVEVKAVEAVARIHEAQLLTCLRLPGKPRGLLLDFNVPVLKDGIYRRALTVRKPPSA